MVGFESISEENLASIGKRTSVAVSEQAVRAFHRHGIAVHGMFVVGLDFDDASSAEATAAFARRLGIDTFQLMMVTPLPGTRLWQRLESEGRLLEADWTLFDGHHAVLRPERMTPLELQLSTLDAMRRFYSRSAIAGAALRGILRHLPELLGIVTRHAGGLMGSLGQEALGPREGNAATPDATSPGAADSCTPVFGRALARVMASLSRDERARLEAALWVAAVRLYGRRRVADFWDQDQSRSHMARLTTLA